MRRPLRRGGAIATLVLALVGGWLATALAQPAADESAEAMDARLVTAVVSHVGPNYLYPDHATTPGLVNPAITQATIHETICSPRWSTKTIRPPASYTTALKRQQLAASHATDQHPADYEEDHLISLELGGHPRDPRNLWPERWGTPAQPLTSRGPFPSHLVGAKSKDAVENALHRAVCSGTLSLREAQWIIATDWFKYYREHVLR
jgi:hypothetical protein